MSRRRYLSTLVSVDATMRRASDAAALFYLMLLPHVEDDATITADPDELAAIVVPNRPGWTVGKIERISAELAGLGLFTPYQGRLYLPPESFYRYQSNIPEAKRRTEQPPANGHFQKKIPEVAENSASPSPSPSPSKHMSDASDVFGEFWTMYPRKEGRGKAREAWLKAVKRTPAETILEGLRRLLPSLERRERRYIPHPSTWLNQERWLDEPDEQLPIRGSPAHVPFKPPPDLTPEERQASLQAMEEARARLAALSEGIGREI